MNGFRTAVIVIGAAVGGLSAQTGTGFAATLQAQYLFSGSLASSVAGAPDLAAVDPLGTSGFTTDTVYGSSRTVYKFNGANLPTANQGGLVFNNGSNLIPSNGYSIALVFKFSEGDGAWRRIVDVQNRQSDNGFYVDPSNKLDLFPVIGGGDSFTTNVYHNVALTVSTTDVVSAYLDGILAFSTTSPLMDITNPDNPSQLVNLFLDNVIAGGQGEWSSGNIALADFFSGVLSADDVAALNSDPFGVPEPVSMALFSTGLLGLGLVRRKRG